MSQKTTVYNTLDEAMDALKLTLTGFRQTVDEIRTSIENNGLHVYNTYLANMILESKGYAGESASKLEQWGVLNATSEKEVRQIIYGIIDEREDAIHHCD